MNKQFSLAKLLLCADMAMDYLCQCVAQLRQSDAALVPTYCKNSLSLQILCQNLAEMLHPQCRLALFLTNTLVFTWVFSSNRIVGQVSTKIDGLRHVR